MSKRLIALLTTSALLFFSTALQAEDRIPIDQVPMYGGMDRNAIPELKAGDEKLINDTTKEFGSREKASAAFVENGYAYYQRDDLVNAMRRFNQAWLINPQNPQAFSGFAAVLHDKKKDCEAMEMMEKALSLNPPVYQGIYADAGQLIALCALNDKTLSAQAKEKLLARSEEIYRKAEEVEINKGYLYKSWTSTYFLRGQYADAWKTVAKLRKAGRNPDERFLAPLREKMPEPAAE
jgi:tetratricopeptide (TPR) repeat protein